MFSPAGRKSPPRYIVANITNTWRICSSKFQRYLLEQAGELSRTLEKANWTDGRETAGYLSSRVKGNEQLAEKHPLALKFGDMILDKLGRHSQFMSAALPLKIVPPLFNRYRDGQS